MHLFLQLFTVAAFLVTVAHAHWMRRRDELLPIALLWLGLVRESFVALRELLYEIDEGALSLGPASLIASVIWSVSIYAAVLFAEQLSGAQLPARGARRPGRGFYLLVGLFMVALVGFYEPFLGRADFAHWEPGTRASFGIPWIALIGYPSLALPMLALFRWVDGRFGQKSAGLAVLGIGTTALALLHAWGLQELKTALGW